MTGAKIRIRTSNSFHQRHKSFTLKNEMYNYLRVMEFASAKIWRGCTHCCWDGTYRKFIRYENNQIRKWWKLHRRLKAILRVSRFIAHLVPISKVPSDLDKYPTSISVIQFPLFYFRYSVFLLSRISVILYIRYSCISCFFTLKFLALIPTWTRSTNFKHHHDL